MRFARKCNDKDLAGKNQTLCIRHCQRCWINHLGQFWKGDRDLTVTKGSDVITIGTNQTTKVKKKILIDAGEEILIKTGKASILMKKDGTINIEGKDITIKASGQITEKASKNIVMKGKKILEN